MYIHFKYLRAFTNLSRKALYNKENVACLKLPFVVEVSSQIAQCKNYTDIKFISRTGTFLQVKTETSVCCTIQKSITLRAPDYKTHFFSWTVKALSLAFLAPESEKNSIFSTSADSPIAADSKSNEGCYYGNFTVYTLRIFHDDVHTFTCWSCRVPLSCYTKRRR